MTKNEQGAQSESGYAFLRVVHDIGSYLWLPAPKIFFERGSLGVWPISNVEFWNLPQNL